MYFYLWIRHLIILNIFGGIFINSMKKILAAALFLILVTGSEIPYLIFRIQQEKLRKEIKIQIHRNISRDQLVLFKVELSEISSLKWIKNNKEFRQGKDLYDIVRSEKNGHFINYYCVSKIL